MICAELDMFPVECVARGYLTGSALAEYAEQRSVCGVGLPPGLKDGSMLPKSIFTPATKAALGEHDENITLRRGRWSMVGQEGGDDDAPPHPAGRTSTPAAIAAEGRADPRRHEAGVRAA